MPTRKLIIDREMDSRRQSLVKIWLPLAVLLLFLLFLLIILSKGVVTEQVDHSQIIPAGTEEKPIPPQPNTLEI